ncbi:MAG: hypothetical protein RLO46_13425 [Pseudomonadales bacterium]
MTNDAECGRNERSSAVLEEYSTALRVLHTIVGRLREEVGGHVSLDEALALLEIVRTEAFGSTIEIRELALALGIDRRAASRHVGTLGQGYSGQRGLGLVATMTSKADRRSRLVALTGDGIDLGCRLGFHLRREALSALTRIETIVKERASQD